MKVYGDKVGGSVKGLVGCDVRGWGVELSGR
jgi:hypothetical protein